MSKSYDGHPAVGRVSFAVNPGEVFGFLGPNGAGKTTAQRILTGLLKPSQGSVWILDYDMARAPQGAKEHNGSVPETANPYTELSAKRTLRLSGEFCGVGGRGLKSRTGELLREFGLWQNEDRFGASNDPDIVGVRPIRHWTDSKIMSCEPFVGGNIIPAALILKFFMRFVYQVGLLAMPFLLFNFDDG